MNKIFSKKVYLMLLAAIVPLWLMNFLSGQNGVSEVKSDQPEAPINNSIVTAVGEQEPMVLKLSMSLTRYDLAEAGAAQPEKQTGKYAGEQLAAKGQDEAALNMSFFLSPAHAADVGTAQSEADMEKKASARQSAERHQEMSLNIEKLTRQKVEPPDEDPFVAKLPPPPPPPPPAPPPPPPAPVAPALPFTFMGRMVENDRTTLFLTRQNQSYSVKVNDVLEREYRVDKIDNDQVIFTYLPLNIQQTLYIGRPG